MLFLQRDGLIVLEGPSHLRRAYPGCLKLNLFASVERPAARVQPPALWGMSLSAIAGTRSASGLYGTLTIPLRPSRRPLPALLIVCSGESLPGTKCARRLP